MAEIPEHLLKRAQAAREKLKLNNQPITNPHQNPQNRILL
ncbi:MAG: hypothetical protein CM15mP49_19470 [Actinomycetota bacterium]|nr:MAG: hypothetical protein CM15mP49_19470 [Actinomycetota bacterium]